MPFGDDENDLPLEDMMVDFNNSLLTLLNKKAQLVPEFERDTTFIEDPKQTKVHIDEGLEELTRTERSPADAFGRAMSNTSLSNESNNPSSSKKEPTKKKIKRLASNQSVGSSRFASIQSFRTEQRKGSKRDDGIGSENLRGSGSNIPPFNMKTGDVYPSSTSYDSNGDEMEKQISSSNLNQRQSVERLSPAGLSSSSGNAPIGGVKGTAEDPALQSDLQALGLRENARRDGASKLPDTKMLDETPSSDGSRARPKIESVKPTMILASVDPVVAEPELLEPTDSESPFGRSPLGVAKSSQSPSSPLVRVRPHPIGALSARQR
jgi:hypothetical protein